MSQEASHSRGRLSGIVVSALDRYLMYLLSISSFLFAWWVASLYYPPLLLPGPGLVYEETVIIVFEEGEFVGHFMLTFYRVIASFLISLVIAIAIGILMGSNERIEQFFEPYVMIGLTVPALAVSMITLLFFGLNSTAVVAAIVISMTPPMVENIWHGTKDLDRSLIKMANLFQASRVQKVRSVILPQLVPYILSATRFGLGIGWKVVVVVEFLGMGNGIGYKINQEYQAFAFEGVLAWTVAFTLVMFALEFCLIKPIESYLNKWRIDVEGATI